jgi:hypothetical protein
MLSLLTNGVIGKGGNFLPVATLPPILTTTLVVDLSPVSLILLVHPENLSKFPKKSNVIIDNKGLRGDKKIL